ncbi:sirohydrochlorin cobaltochelatase [Malonomonas rubra]|uniref:sirohydrochlorin cobaltochelatase n=1 Tax=Malonomonas rubra TaxID=57040 RepID=UPI0026F06777|nr:sirohydrochlorin cobaltochelatase [Malonomonas rubra]
MLHRTLKTLLSLALISLLLSGGSLAMQSDNNKTEKTAIVVAAFGTTYPSAVNSLQSIVRDIESTYPHTPVQMAFTSNIIRKKWHSRADDQEYRNAHPEVPDYFYNVKNVLGAMADLQNQGYKTIVVQPTHLTHGEEYLDVEAYVEGLRSIKTFRKSWQPFDKIALGRPLMGSWGPRFPYPQDIEELAQALGNDAKATEKQKATLVYMGHGNKLLSTALYYEFELEMNKRYPQVKTVVGLVEGHPSFDEAIEKLKNGNNKKLLLKPLMVVAGDHATNDMAGNEEDSWKTRLLAKGYQITPVLEGLGDNPAVRRMFINHLQDAATEAGIELR